MAVNMKSATAKRCVDSLALFAVLVAAIGTWAPVLPWRRQGVIHVSPGGRDWHAGASARWPVRTVQHALHLARPGDTILLHPGRYAERLIIRRSGEPGNPITLRALEPGTVLITGAAAEDTMRGRPWEVWTEHVFVVRAPHRIWHLRADEKALFPCRNPGMLRAYAGRAGAYPAFSWEDGMLYVAFPDGSHPDTHALTTHRPVPMPLANGVWKACNVWVEADHLRFEGLRFDFGVGLGIQLFSAEAITVADSAFSGCQIGVLATGRFRPARDLHVTHSLFHNYPQGDWTRGWLSKQEAYACAGEPGLVLASGDGTRVVGNLVTHFGDALRLSTADVDITRGIEATQNLLAWGTDDAIEFDGFAKHIRFHRNLVYDVHESLGTSPVLSGPVTIERNLFLHPAEGINGAQVKLLNPWMNRGPPLAGPIRNIRIRDNTFVGNWLVWYGNCPIQDMLVERNIFAVQRRIVPFWPEGVTESGNIYIALPTTTYSNPGQDPRWLRGAVLADPALRDQAPAGAVAPGDAWTMTRPGPRWLDWHSLPATKKLVEVLDKELFTE